MASTVCWRQKRTETRHHAPDEERLVNSIKEACDDNDFTISIAISLIYGCGQLSQRVANYYTDKQKLRS
ncbi:hypothetical protein EUGRSUZ_C03078 [Eucalyptus grandis]|uniref:Uncharacterized protein n=2 Tax=Eucalyptus grandis TaxID=71139 RepID=A0ACC3LHZ1_EUCGR|nr:hypothetical protein EUGRSUZ_C03078 [Eucalyptus grandis]